MSLTDKERLQICSSCKNRKLDRSLGLICSLTNQKGNFENNCYDYITDTVESERLKSVDKKISRSILDVIVPGKHYYATPFILFANIILFCIVALYGSNFLDISGDVLLQWGANFPPKTLNHEPWRLISNFFLHGSLMHFLLNMYSLCLVGYFLEPILGPRKYLSIYILLGICSSVISLWWNEFMLTVGASGSIFGLYGMLIILLLTRKVEIKNKLGVLIVMLLLTGSMLVSGFIKEVSFIKIDNAAHLGGLAAGIIFGLIIFPSIYWSANIALSVLTQILLLSGVVTGSYYALQKIPDNMSKYINTMNAFVENESEALFIFNLSTYKYVESYRDEIDEVGIGNWEKNIRLLNGLKNNVELPPRYEEKIVAYKKYCKLRIKQYEAMLKMLDSKGDLFGNEVSFYKTEIDSILINYPLLR